MIDTGLAGAVVVVTGGASGIGAAVCRAFAAQGARVAVHWVDDAAVAPDGTVWEHAEPARTAAEALVSSLPDARAFTADLSIEGSEAALIDAVAAEMGEIDVLINNAAHCESPDVYEGLSSAGLERHYRVNAIAPAMLISELARRSARRGISIVNVSTDAARAIRRTGWLRIVKGGARSADTRRGPGSRRPRSAGQCRRARADPDGMDDR